MEEGYRFGLGIERLSRHCTPPVSAPIIPACRPAVRVEISRHDSEELLAGLDDPGHS